ncbi:MAG: histidine kinase N-terminal 7TM domain-containing protein [Chthoniobacterales bacterium]
MEFPWQLAVLYATACIALGLAVLGRMYRGVLAANAFSLNYLFAAVWCVLYAADLQSSSFEEKLFLVKLRFFLLPAFSLVVLEMTYRFINGRKLFTGWRLVAALIIPCATAVFALSINENSIFQYDAWLDTSGPVALLRMKRGPWYMIFHTYSYLLIFYSYLLILFSMPRAAPWARRTRIIFLIGRIIPIILDVCYLLHITSPVGLNYAPISVGLTGLLVGYAIFGDRLGTLIHVARYELVEKLNDLLIVLDPQNRVVDLNKAASAAFGISIKDAMHIPAAEFFQDDPQIVSSLGGADVAPFEITRHEEDYVVTLTPIEGSRHGKPPMLLLFHNITRRKKAERAQFQAKQAAEEANEAKSRYLAVMSHEIRSPLNSVLGFMQLLQDTPLNKEQKEYINHISQSGGSLLAIINEILDYSKIEAGQIQLMEVPFDLRAELETLCGGMLSEAERKGIDLSWRVLPDVPPVVIGDKLRILQVLRNLISNAVKFTERGGVKIEASCRSRRKTGDQETAFLFFSVVDTGIGISQSEIERLFQPFSQANNLTQLQYGGTGLGLTITRRLSELMGGNVTVESVPEQGSKFTASVKLQIGVPTMLKMPQEAVPLRDSAALKILVTDDQVANRRLLQLMLGRMHHEVELAEDGFACLAHLEENDFDVIIMDIEMLGMDGFETTRKVRELELERARNASRPIYIIALTAHASTDIREQCYAADMNDYLSKPITTQALTAALYSAQQWRAGPPDRANF